MVEFYKGFFDFKLLKKLLNIYNSAENVAQKLTDDPYDCLCKLTKTAFKTADKILLSFNEECIKMKANGEQPPIDLSYDLLTSYQRQKAAIMFLLEENENDGNTKIDIKKIRKQVEILANQSILHFADVIKNDVDIYFDQNTSNLALKETYNTEKYIADRIIEGLKINNKWEIKKDKDYSKFDDVQLTEEQIKTIDVVCNSNISILRGSGGAGKSQSTKAVINMLKDNYKSFVIFSPTGRAAKVISDFTKEQASTIHRGLGYIPPNWSYNEEYPLYVDIVIVDETSMVDIFLMKHLLEAIDFNKTKILFIGDSNQIPSVGAGNVFFDMINSNIIPTNTLTKIFRYGTGGILTVATQTWKCEKFLDNQTQPQIFGEDKGYMFIPLSQENILSNVIGLYKKLLTKGYLKEDIMILSSYNKGDYGTVNINKHLQPISNPNVELNGNNIVLGDIKFYEGDLVIQTKNNYKAIKYSLNSFAFEDEVVFVPNGEIGIIKEISYNSVIIEFSDVKVVYSKEDLINVKLAYSISIHRAQGGQCKIVILLTPKAHTYMLNSNLIYVGQTRAKERVFHLGEIETVNKAIKKKADFNRNTFLKDLLI
jgi:exodeoxyribonuclease V alpha subunit